ncbi:MAG: hypothetical protein JW863_09950 [Chitinispirillaceae bacterium]|nr:hypothetical protein [Chitinispirillaceae bacterium]
MRAADTVKRFRIVFLSERTPVRCPSPSLHFHGFALQRNTGLILGLVPYSRPPHGVPGNQLSSSFSAVKGMNFTITKGNRAASRPLFTHRILCFSIRLLLQLCPVPYPTASSNFSSNFSAGPFLSLTLRKQIAARGIVIGGIPDFGDNPVSFLIPVAAFMAHRAIIIHSHP